MADCPQERDVEVADHEGVSKEEFACFAVLLGAGRRFRMGEVERSYPYEPYGIDVVFFASCALPEAGLLLGAVNVTVVEEFLKAGSEGRVVPIGLDDLVKLKRRKKTVLSQATENL